MWRKGGKKDRLNGCMIVDAEGYTTLVTRASVLDIKYREVKEELEQAKREIDELSCQLHSTRVENCILRDANAELEEKLKKRRAWSGSNTPDNRITVSSPEDLLDLS